MYKQFQDIKSIVFPIYKLPHSDWYRQDGILWMDGLVLDEANMPGRSLGIRRLQSGRQDLHYLKKAILDVPGLINSKWKIFIDSVGTPFIYNKTITAPLIYHQVRKIEQKDSCSVLWVKGSRHGFILQRPPYGDPRWARLLYYKGVPWTVFDFQLTRNKDSRRRV